MGALVHRPDIDFGIDDMAGKPQTQRRRPGTRGTGRKARMFPQRLKPVYARFFVGPKGPTAVPRSDERANRDDSAMVQGEQPG